MTWTCLACGHRNRNDDGPVCESCELDARRVWATVDKSRWGPGPWQDEPDKAHWVDTETDLDCLVVRGPMSAWCGYVGLPPGHRLHGRRYDDDELLDVSVHGGLTFADRCMEGLPAGEGVCHVPLPGRPDDVWWLGFDCGHYTDVVPAMVSRMPSGLRNPHATYRTLDYVRRETTRLAEQLR